MLAGWLLALVAIGSGSAGPADPGPRQATEILPSPAGLHHVFQLTDRVYSGSQPESEAALAVLARMGVTTVVSVDGALPDVEAARRQGLRYVHLPVGYDGIPSNRVAQLARVGSLPGRIYVHCHHGRHRGPAAAAVVCRLVSGWSADVGQAFLRQAGTAPEYAGLYRSVRDLEPASVTAGGAGELPERTPTTPVVGAMVEIDRLMDSLKKLQAAGWKGLAGAGDGRAQGRPGQETAVLLWEQLRELGRHPDTAARPADYRSGLDAAEAAAAALKTLCSGPSSTAGVGDKSLSAAALDGLLDRLNQTCIACHQGHRN